MSENALQTAQQFLQDVLAPDVRELKVRIQSIEKEIESLQQQMNVRFTALDQKNDAQFKALHQKSDMQFEAIMAAIRESRAQAELTSMRVVANLSERVAVPRVTAAAPLDFAGSVTSRRIPPGRIVSVSRASASQPDENVRL